MALDQSQNQRSLSTQPAIKESCLGTAAAHNATFTKLPQISHSGPKGYSILLCNKTNRCANTETEVPGLILMSGKFGGNPTSTKSSETSQCASQDAMQAYCEKSKLIF